MTTTDRLDSYSSDDLSLSETSSSVLLLRGGSKQKCIVRRGKKEASLSEKRRNFALAASYFS
uniref:Uncharacterized protein n=1 Tax=Oryza brachyantha TaxID=4533 RepID=J3M3K1_ORYBR